MGLQYSNDPERKNSDTRRHQVRLNKRNSIQGKNFMLRGFMKPVEPV